MRQGIARMLGVGIVWLLATGAGRAADYNVRDYGAAGDGRSLVTPAIQKAIDAAATAGGGTVVLPPGTFRSGTIFLKSNVTFSLEAGAVLLGSADGKDYPPIRSKIRSYTDKYVCQSLIAGEGLEHVAIVGRGTIDGNGAAFCRPEYKTRPYVIRLVGCRDVRVEGVRLQSSPMWMQHYLACDQVRIRDVTVFNHASYNADGLDIDGCHDVCIDGCMIDSDDDGVCLKSTLDRPCRNVVVSNCVISSHCEAIKMGTESNGGFQDVAVSNCTICAPRFTRSIYPNLKHGTTGGIALEIVDGGTLERVAISNITMTGVNTPIFIRLGNRGRPFQENGPKPAIGELRGVLVSNIVATGATTIGCSITGLPDHCVEDVSLRDVHLTFEGGGTAALAGKPVPENEAKYPASTMFNVLPAYGFFCRHIRGLKLQNVRLDTAQPDQRPAMICDDVKDLLVDGLDAVKALGPLPLVRLTQVENVLFRACTLRNPVDTFLRLEGPATAHVVLMGNDLSRAGKPTDLAPDVSRDALREIGNESAAGK